MGFFFTVFYLVTAYLTPTALFGTLGEYHVETLIGTLAIVFSIPRLSQSGVLKTRQSFAVLAFSLAIFMSVASTGWLGGAAQALFDFAQTALAFFLVAINFTRKRHFQILALTFFLCSTLYILLGARDLYDHVVPSIYLHGDGTLRRIRGLGFVNDPNDFGQLLVSLVPAIFLWKRPGVVANIFLVGVPLCVLVTGLYLTHSRGAMIALSAVILISSRRKFGTIPAAIGAGLLSVGIAAAGWSGGRDVSMDAGADRLDLWAAGLAMVKAHPLFGVGLGGFAEANGITAHNSVVICAAELGVIGLFFWTLLLFTSFRNAICYDKAARGAKDNTPKETELPSRLQAHQLRGTAVATPSPVQRNVRVAEPVTLNYVRSSSIARPYPGTYIPESVASRGTAHPLLAKQQNAAGGSPFDQANTLSAAEISGILRILITSLAGFLVAGWFLSRALSMWLFMYCGMLYAASHMAHEIGLVPSKDSMSFTLRWSLAVTIALLVLVSVILRLRNFGG